MKEEAISATKEFLQKNSLCVLSTISAEGKPESSLVMYLLDGDFDIYFMTRKETRKCKNLETNKNVSIVIGTEAAPTTVQGEGVVEEISKEKSKEFIDTLSKRADIQQLYFGPFTTVEGMNFVVYKVKMNWLRILRINPWTGKEDYEQIIP